MAEYELAIDLLGITYVFLLSLSGSNCLIES